MDVQTYLFYDLWRMKLTFYFKQSLISFLNLINKWTLKALAFEGRYFQALEGIRFVLL
jgi:hypothetical protein